MLNLFGKTIEKMTITLDIEDKKVEQAAVFAQKQGKTLSTLVENYFDSLLAKDQPANGIVRKLKKMTANLHQLPDFDHKTDFQAYQKRKHG